MVLTASFALFPVIGRFCHRHRLESFNADLTSASRGQNHTTSPSAFAPFVVMRKNVHRIPPNVRDDGQRPSFGRDGRACRNDLPDGLSEIFLQEALDTHAADLPVGQISRPIRQRREEEEGAALFYRQNATTGIPCRKLAPTGPAGTA
jgi:hypothetical protein